MIKKLLIVLLCLASAGIYAQNSTASPYSFYGIGTLKFRGTVENRSMGGLSIFTDSIHVNLRNPTSYVGPNLQVLNFDGTSRPVKFSVAGSYNSLNLQSQSNEEKTSTVSFDYLALSFPIGRFGIGLGLVPYTAVGYRLESDPDDNGLVDNRYRGEGGLNKAFLGLGYRINDNFSVGVDVSYNFGNTQNDAVRLIYDDDDNLIQYQTREENRSDLSGLNTNFALSYRGMITESLELRSSVIFAPKSELTSNNTRTISTIIFDEQSGESENINSIEADLDSENLKSTDLSLPSRLAFGAGIGKPRKWFLGAEYTRQNSSQFSNPIFEIEEANFVDASAIALGGFFIPDYNSFSSYWKRVTYRAGLRTEHTGLMINGEDIKEFGISFGVGLPVGLYFSNANIGFELGKRGTTDQNLIQENFFRINISLSLSDRWFEKLKYN